MQPHAEALYWGLKFSAWVDVAGLIVGPIVAVLVTLWIDARRRNREQKLSILRLLLRTRHIGGDLNYSYAVNLIPVEFAGHAEVQSAYRSYIEAANVQVTDDSRERAVQNAFIKQTKMIFTIARALGFKIAETDLQTTAFLAESWTLRDALALDSQKAARDIANQLQLHLLVLNRRLAQAPLTPEERAFLSISDQET